MYKHITDWDGIKNPHCGYRTIEKARELSGGSPALEINCQEFPFSEGSAYAAGVILWLRKHHEKNIIVEEGSGDHSEGYYVRGIVFGEPLHGAKTPEELDDAWDSLVDEAYSEILSYQDAGIRREFVQYCAENKLNQDDKGLWNVFHENVMYGRVGRYGAEYDKGIVGNEVRAYLKEKASSN